MMSGQVVHYQELSVNILFQLFHLYNQMLYDQHTFVYLLNECYTSSLAWKHIKIISGSADMLIFGTIWVEEYR